MAAGSLKKAHTDPHGAQASLPIDDAPERPQRRTRPAQDGWRIEDHVCRSCFCRVLSRPAQDGGRIYRCSGCGAEAHAHSSSSICACGMRLKNGRDLGIRCVINEAPSPEAPVQVVARQVVT